jgi:hypothetical protein
MAVIQTDATPPNQGRIIFVIIGWIWNKRKALKNIVKAYKSMVQIIPYNPFTRQARAGSMSLAGDTFNGLTVGVIRFP